MRDAPMEGTPLRRVLRDARPADVTHLETWRKKTRKATQSDGETRAMQACNSQQSLCLLCDEMFEKQTSAGIEFV